MLEAFERAKRAIDSYGTHVEELSVAVEGFLAAAVEKRVPGDSERVLHSLPGFRASVEEWQRAYAEVFASEDSALPAMRPQLLGLRDDLRDSRRLAARMRDTLRGLVDEVDRLDPEIAKPAGELLRLVVAEWDVAESRAEAILTRFDEHIVPIRDGATSSSRSRDEAVDWREYIRSNPRILSGKPVLKGTRISVELILDLFSAGWTEADVLESYPHLTREGVRAAFAYASERVAAGTGLPVSA